MAVRTYDPADVIVTIDGNNINGYADGTFVSIERTEQTFTKVTGADGSTTRSKTNDRSGTLTLTLLQTSPSNEILSNILNQDEADNTGVVAVQVKERSSGSKFATGSGWIQGLPTIEYGNEITTREWTIEMSEIKFNVSGVESQSGGAS